jgi:formate dehydrogenase maturation protein FdhE
MDCHPLTSPRRDETPSFTAYGFSKRAETVLTAEQREAYVENAGATCPACGSMGFVGNGLTFEAGHIIQRITCSDCSEEWFDVYALVAIQQEG